MIIKSIMSGGINAAVNYIFDGKKMDLEIQKNAEILLVQDLREPLDASDLLGRNALINGFKFQTEQNLALKKCLQHTIISFDKNDSDKITNELLIDVASEYAKKAGLENTCFIVVRHKDREHEHLHLLASRVDNEGKTISNKFIKMRDIERAQIIARQYGLTPSLNNAKNGKLNYERKTDAKNIGQTHIENMPNDQKMRYEIFQKLQVLVLHQSVTNWKELEEKLNAEEIRLQFYKKEDKIIGVSFEKNEFKFSGIKIDKSCSFGELNQQLIRNAQNLKVKNESIKTETITKSNQTASNLNIKQNLAINRTSHTNKEEELKKKGMRR